jgi:hypothetical protein
VRRQRIAVAASAVTLGIGTVVAVLEATNERAYPTRNEAVLRACHAVKIMRDLANGVTWQDADASPGVGWLATLKRTSAGYIVTDCKHLAVTHA